LAEIPVGLSDAAITAALAVIEAQGEINNVPPPRLDDILEKARGKMLLKTQRPIIDPQPSEPPLLNP